MVFWETVCLLYQIFFSSFVNMIIQLHLIFKILAPYIIVDMIVFNVCIGLAKFV